MKTYNDTIVFTDLKGQTVYSLQGIYNDYYGLIKRYVLNNNGTQEDAEDLFQETILVLIEKSTRNDFVLTASLKTYVFSIARNLWLKQLRSQTSTTTDEHLEQLADTNEIEHWEEQEHSLQKILTQITARCKQILQALFVVGEPMEKLMMRMGWKNKHTAANQKYKCIEQAQKKSAE